MVLRIVVSTERLFEAFDVRGRLSTELSIDDRKSVREDEIIEKNFSYSTDQFSCDGNSNDFDVDLNSDNEEGGLFHVKDGVIQSFKGKCVQVPG